MSTLSIYLLVGLLFSVLLQITAKPVAEWLGPRKSGDSPTNYFRVIASMIWFVFVPVVAVVLEIVFFVSLILSLR